MTHSTVRMHIPALGGAQTVNTADIATWEKQGAYLLPDLTREEIAAADATVKATALQEANARTAQQAADALRLKEDEAALAAALPDAKAPARVVAPAVPVDAK